MDPWELAARLERCALGWRNDALFYLGERRAIRERHADRLMDRAWEVLEHA